MNHPGIEDWISYIRGELSPEDRDVWEAHLERCEACLALYIEAMERCAPSLPELPDESHFVDRLMEQFDAISDRNASTEAVVPPANVRPGPAAALRSTERLSRRTRLYRHPLFHYGLAAVITMILMSAGLFESVADTMGHWEKSRREAVAEGVKPMSDTLMEKTSAVLDSIQPKRDRGGNR